MDRSPESWHMRRRCVGLWLKRYHFKIFLSLPLVAMFSAVRKLLINLGRGHHDEYFCEVILNLIQWFMRRCGLTLSLPNATVVEFTLQCQTQLQSKFTGTVDIGLFLTVIWDATLCSLSPNV